MHHEVKLHIKYYKGFFSLAQRALYHQVISVAVFELQKQRYTLLDWLRLQFQGHHVIQDDTINGSDGKAGQCDLFHGLAALT